MRFTKADLKTGDFIVRENGDVEILIKELGALVCQRYGYNYLSDLEEDLTCKDNYEYNVKEVYRPIYAINACFNNFSKGELVYKREKEQIVKLTKQQIEELLGYKIKIEPDK